jgi:hypothetical protein
MDELNVKHDVTVCQSAEQEREDILWKYKYFIFELATQRRSDSTPLVGATGVGGKDGVVHKRHRRKV